MKNPAIETAKRQFLETLALAREVFGDDAFRLTGVGGGKGKLSKPLYDAQMIALFNLYGRADEIRRRRIRVKDAVVDLARTGSSTYDLMVGRGNTAIVIKERIDTVQRTIQGILDETKN
jgi:hypothetical protein